MASIPDVIKTNLVTVEEDTPILEAIKKLVDIYENAKSNSISSCDILNKQTRY